MITYREVKGKYVLHKNGVYIALTKEQISELKLVIEDIESGEMKLHRKDNRGTDNG